MTAAEVRAELERIWREFPCMQAKHKLGLKLKSDLSLKIKGEGYLAGGYWLIKSDLLVMTRGQRCPLLKRKSKYRGHGRAYLTPIGYERARFQRERTVKSEVVRAWSYCSD